MTETPDPLSSADQPEMPARRHALRLGAVGAVTVMSVRPALAQTVGSVMHCNIPVPDPSKAGGWIAADGSVVAAGTAGAFPPPGTMIKGEDA